MEKLNIERLVNKFNRIYCVSSDTIRKDLIKEEMRISRLEFKKFPYRFENTYFLSAFGKLKQKYENSMKGGYK